MMTKTIFNDLKTPIIKFKLKKYKKEMTNYIDSKTIEPPMYNLKTDTISNSQLSTQKTKKKTTKKHKTNENTTNINPKTRKSRVYQSVTANSTKNQNNNI